MWTGSSCVITRPLQLFGVLELTGVSQLGNPDPSISGGVRRHQKAQIR